MSSPLRSFRVTMRRVDAGRSAKVSEHWEPLVLAPDRDAAIRAAQPPSIGRWRVTGCVEESGAVEQVGGAA